MIFSVATLLVSYCIVSLVFRPSSASSRLGRVYSFVLSSRRNGVVFVTDQPECTNYIGGPGACPPPPGKMIENWTLGNSIFCIPCRDQTQPIHTCILLSFSQSLVINDSRAKVQRFMIPKLKQRFMILKCFVVMIHDSYFRFHPRLIAAVVVVSIPL